MVGKSKTKLVVSGLAIFAVVALAFFFFLKKNPDSNESTIKNSQIKSTTTSINRTDSTRPLEESTTTSLVLQNISISLSTPFANQKFNNESVPVRAIIAGATTGTCELKFSKAGSKSFEFEAPIISAPTYFTCQGFDIEPSNFKEKGEWTLELSVNSANGKSVSEKRKIEISS